MTPRRFLLLLGLVALAMDAAAKTKDTGTGGSTTSLDHGIFDWVRSAPGGVYHPAQTFRTDPATGITGVFATEDIPEDTVLVSVPWSHVIISDDPTEEGQLCCGLVDRLKREWKLGKKSQFAPYIEYLKKGYTEKSNTQLPTTWSKRGQALLEAIVGTRPSTDDPMTNVNQTILPPENPFRWLQDDWFPLCGGKASDKLGIQAALVVIQRSDDDILIPGYDMYNHRNGEEYLNTETSIENEKKHMTVATRDIQAGEQIYISYNMCQGCTGRRHHYGTGEILRDYGFVEMMPQRFYYQGGHELVQFDIDEYVDEETGESRLELTWDEQLKPKLDHRSKVLTLPLLGFFRQQIRRLRKLKNVDYRKGNPGMPAHEWETCWQFQLANIRAMTLAMESLEEDLELEASVSVNVDDLGTAHLPHYDSLGEEPDDLKYAEETCDNVEALTHPHHKLVFSEETHYQDLNFRIEPETRDVLMELDSVTQIASIYRPQYHEYSVHAAARFLDSVKRVIFIGGGDSMLLHEVLKYPELELVVGLELDQMVTRKSFKYFHTQPHFDDPRVEWWFGDATKSLLLLPKDYWQSFDLVLVDLSETVMSFSVTTELDVFDALALLLKPEGVLVKNELYMDTISQAFDHSVQICYQSPIICDQVMTMGSNKVDFIHSPVKDHGIPNLLYTPLVTSENRHDFLHDYRQNDARVQGKCDMETSSTESLGEQSKSAGILEVVDAEETTAPLDESLMTVFEQIAQDEGFHLTGDSVYTKGILIIPMKEGYILARLLPDEKYCNMDINLWGSFHKLKSLTTALTKTLGSNVVSSFRVVVGGMYGSSTWNQDRDLIGPQMVQTRNCSEREAKEANSKDAKVEKALVKAALDESIAALVNQDKALAVVLCGTKKEECLAKEVFSKSAKIDKIVQLTTCSGLNSDEPTTLYDCEISLLSEWRKALAGSTADIVVLDATAPKEMLQIVNSILHDDDFRESVIGETNVVLTWSVQPDEEPWRAQFLDRYRKQHKKDPISRAGYRIESGNVAVELGVVSAGDESVAYHLETVERNLQKQFSDAAIELHVIHGGKYVYWDPWEPEEFFQSHYDDTAALAQYFEQKPTVQHSIFQLEPMEGVDFQFDQESLNKSFEESLDHVEFTCPTKFTVNNVGEGCVIVCLNPEFGSVILTWDGRQHIDISYHLADDDATELERFLWFFKSTNDFLLDSALRDDMPRGTGRVVNFPEDLMSKEDRDDFFEDLFRDDREIQEAAMYASLLGPTQKVKAGSCSIPGADPATCWPDPPPLAKVKEGSCSAAGADPATCWPDPPPL